jgi:hypothetical protein
MGRKKKQQIKDVMIVKRREYLLALKILSDVIQVMGVEFQEIRGSKAMDPELRKTLMQLSAAHLQNVTQVSMALSQAHTEVNPMTESVN